MKSKPLLEYLYARCSSEFTYRFQWKEGSIAFWDNRAMASGGQRLSKEAVV